VTQLDYGGEEKHDKVQERSPRGTRLVLTEAQEVEEGRKGEREGGRKEGGREGEREGGRKEGGREGGREGGTFLKMAMASSWLISSCAFSTRETTSPMPRIRLAMRSG